MTLKECIEMGTSDAVISEETLQVIRRYIRHIVDKGYDEGFLYGISDRSNKNLLNKEKYLQQLNKEI